jgi:hypothetical protein
MEEGRTKRDGKGRGRARGGRRRDVEKDSVERGGGMHGNTLGRTRRGGTRKMGEAEVGTNRKDAMGKARIREGVTHRIDSYTYKGTCIARRRTKCRSFPRWLPDLEREGKRLQECILDQRGKRVQKKRRTKKSTGVSSSASGSPHTGRH